MSVIVKKENMIVFVKNQRNEPLMSTTCRKAKVLLKQGKAKVIRITPFTISYNDKQD